MSSLMRAYAHLASCSNLLADSAQRDVVVEIREAYNLPLFHQYTTTCEFCGLDILSNKHGRHVNSCDKKLALKRDKFSTCELPDPPQDLQILGAPTSSGVRLSWGVPLFDGGCPIYEYRIALSTCKRTFHGKKVTRNICF